MRCCEHLHHAGGAVDHDGADAGEPADGELQQVLGRAVRCGPVQDGDPQRRLDERDRELDVARGRVERRQRRDRVQPRFRAVRARERVEQGDVAVVERPLPVEQDLGTEIGIVDDDGGPGEPVLDDEAFEDRVHEREPVLPGERAGSGAVGFAGLADFADLAGPAAGR